MGQEVHFSDHISILTYEYDSIVFNPVYSENVGVFLYSEGEKPIKYITLNDSIITLYYLDGDTKSLEGTILSVDVEDIRFKRRMKISINGNLLKYSKEDAIYYDLDMTKAFPKEIIMAKTRKRSL